uniref:Uncharacterized protein n=1 Tax=Avena sativa TaxID=4498 RepID=A0ACD5XYJ7_AVESA
MRMLARDVHAIDMGSSGVGGLARWGGGLGGNGGPYAFGTLFQNELILTGCNVQARLLGGTNGSSVLGGCSTFCYLSEPGGEPITGLVIDDRSSICSGIGCCQASIPVGYPLYEVRVTRLAGDEAYGVPVHALVAEIGWLTPHRASDLMTAARMTAAAAAPLEVPVILTWSVRHRVEARDPDTTLCMDIGNGDYMCLCMAGYKGNPYLPHGCQDYNECELAAEDIDCFGECTDLPGSYECRCPPGTSGDHSIPGGCVNNTTDEVLSSERGDQVTIAVTKDLSLWNHAIARMEDKFNKKLSQEQIEELAEIFKMVIQELPLENSAKL